MEILLGGSSRCLYLQPPSASFGLKNGFGSSSALTFVLAHFAVRRLRLRRVLVALVCLLPFAAATDAAAQAQDPVVTNNPPVFAQASASRSVVENAFFNTQIGEPLPAATDQDGDSLTYSLGGTDAAAFRFDPATRQLWVKILLNFEEKASYSVEMKASDGFGGEASLMVAVAVTDAVEEDADIALFVSPSSVPESGGPHTVTVRAVADGNGAFNEDQVVTVSVAASGKTEVVGFTEVPDFTITLPMGQSSASAKFDIAPFDGGTSSYQLDEDNETAFVTGTAASGIAVKYTILTIEDDDVLDMDLSILGGAAARRVPEGGGAKTLALEARVLGACAVETAIMFGIVMQRGRGDADDVSPV